MDVRWDPDSEEHVVHRVQWHEIEEALMPPIVINKVQRGAHRVLGVTFAGRHLALFVRLDGTGNATKLITARDMVDGERRTYRRRGRKG